MLQIQEGIQNINDQSAWIYLDTISQIKPAERQVVPYSELNLLQKDEKKLIYAWLPVQRRVQNTDDGSLVELAG